MFCNLFGTALLGAGSSADESAYHLGQALFWLLVAGVCWFLYVQCQKDKK